jgi:hypothetical protein
MTRHFLALFALLSGLAALSGPAYAACGAVSPANVGVASVSVEKTAKAPQLVVEAGEALTKRGSALCSVPAPRQPQQAPFQVLIGIDRARE